MKSTMIKRKLWILSMIGTICLTSGCSSLLKGGWSLVPPSGRPLRIQGNSVAGEICREEGIRWAKGQRPDSSQLDEPTRVALEALWLQDARGEHASIPAFSRISWQLAMLGAPPELLEWAHKAALEEIGHAQLCFAIAEGYGNCSYSVQPIPEMWQGGFDLTDDPIELMVSETLFDGCLIEGFSAHLAAAAHMQCKDPAILAALEKIAGEEKSHTAFSWALLEWLLERYPVKVRAIVQSALPDLELYRRPRAVDGDLAYLVMLADQQLLIEHGKLPDEQWQAIWASHMEDTKQKLEQLVSITAM
jgi:hypothetical protein